jgi:glutamate racemase
MNSKPIGVFDSGIGGLTVYRALRELLPHEQVVFLGDTARLPYGSKSPDAIRSFTEGNALFLLSKNVKIIVIACNSAASHAAEHLQARIDIPVVEVINPGVEAAVAVCRKKIGIIGTTATISSGAYERGIRALRSDLEIFSRDCPLFVPLVEEGWINHPATRLVVEEYLSPLRDQGVDTLVLGCTHYPVLRPLIAEVMGPNVHLVDSALPTARRIDRLLDTLGWKNDGSQPKADAFYVTDYPDRFRRVAEIFLDKAIENVITATFTTIAVPQA